MFSITKTAGYLYLTLILALSIAITGCSSSMKNQKDKASLSGLWKMTPETSAHAVGLISKDNPILFSFDLKEDSTAVLYFVDSNGKLPKTGTWSTKSNASLSKNEQTDLLIYYNDSTRVVAIGYKLDDKAAPPELISLQKEHYQQDL